MDLQTMEAFIEFQKAQQAGTLYPNSRNQRGTLLDLADVLGRRSKTRDNVKSLMSSYMKQSTQKHTGVGLTSDMPSPINEFSFFIDCELEAPVINATLTPMESLLSVLESRPNRNELISVAAITDYAAVREVPTGSEAECDPAMGVTVGFGACKLQLPFGKRQNRTTTGDSNTLIKRACRGIYDDFYFIGDIRGVSATPFQEFTPNDRDLIIRGAVLNALNIVGREMQFWMQESLWTGTPAANTGQDLFFWGLDALINDDYPASGLPLTGYNDVNDCSALNSDVKDFESTCIGAANATTGLGIWGYVQELEDTIYRRAKLMGLLPLEAVWVMRPEHWYEFSKAVPCEMVGDGCSGATFAGTTNVNVNDGGSGMFNLSMRQEMQDSMSIRVNGRLYRVILDDAIPAVRGAAPNTSQLTASIYFIPLRAAGNLVTWIDYLDYSFVNEVMQPIPMTRHMQGWTDQGRYHNIIQERLWCFEVTSKIEPRLVFRAPQLAGRIDNVIACPLQIKPTAHPDVITQAV